MTETPVPVDHAIPAPGEDLCGIAWDGTHLWHADAGTDTLYCLDWRSGRVLRQLSCPDVRTCTDFADGLLWQVAGRPKRLRAIDPDTGAVHSEVTLRSETICGLAVAGDRFWTTEEEGRILQCELSDGTVVNEIEARPRIAGVAAVADSLWYTVDRHRLLVQVDPRTGSETDRYSTPGIPTGLGFDGRRLWVTDMDQRRLLALGLP